jgi:hypothetical protein
MQVEEATRGDDTRAYIYQLVRFCVLTIPPCRLVGPALRTDTRGRSRCVCTPPRRVGVFPRSEPEQALPHSQLQEARGSRDYEEAGPESGCHGRKLCAGQAVSATLYWDFTVYLHMIAARLWVWGTTNVVKSTRSSYMHRSPATGRLGHSGRHRDTMSS